MRIISCVLSLLLLITFTSCENETPSGAELDRQLEAALELLGGKAAFILPASNNFDKIPQDPRNPLSQAKVQLGGFLFHETGFALNPRIGRTMGTFSCASCHHAPAGFQAGIRQGIGEGGIGYGFKGEARRNAANFPIDSLDVQPLRTPSALNTAYQQVMLWNGQFGATGPNIGTEANWTPDTPIATNTLGYEGVETQAIAGLTVHRMAFLENYIDSLGYKSMFADAFPNLSPQERYSTEAAGLAIAAYERTILANEAPFQQWLGGNTTAMDDFEKRGAILFFGKAGCGSCHQGPALNSMEFHALGMGDMDGPGLYGTAGEGAEQANKGRGGFTGLAEDMYKFKVPQLYNLTHSPFYGHGGTFESIREVVEYKNMAVPEKTSVSASQLSDEFVPLGLSSQEVDEIVAFLEISLNDDKLLRYQPTSLPSGQCFPNADLQSQIDLSCN